MPRPSAGRSGALAEVYRRFGEVEAAGTSPLYERVAVALSESGDALRAIGTAPARKRHPTVILAALHDLALAGRAPALAAAYAAGDGAAAAGAAVDTLLRMTEQVVALAVRRPPRPEETGRCAVLYPLIAEAAHRVGAATVGLIDVGCSAGLNLTVDRVGISYGNGQSLGDPASPVRMSASIVGGRPVPDRPMPEVLARVGVDLDPVDVTDPDEARWLRACVWPDQREQAARLDAELALAAAAPPLLLRGELVDVLPDAVARVPAGAPPPGTPFSAWRCSTGRGCAPRPSGAAGRGVACWRGWRSPSAVDPGRPPRRPSGAGPAGSRPGPRPG